MVDFANDAEVGPIRGVSRTSDCIAISCGGILRKHDGESVRHFGVIGSLFALILLVLAIIGEIKSVVNRR